jgi:two-component system, NtrC family, nitrogen regulation sensor histidine kinase NtrY
LKKYFFIVISLILLTIGFFVEKNQFAKDYFKRKSETILKNKLSIINAKQLAILKNEKLIDIVSKFEHSSSLYDEINHEKLLVYAYQNKCLAYWNDNRLVFQNFSIDKPYQTQFIHNQNGWYQIVSARIGDYDIYCAYHFYKQYPKNNDYFVNEFDEQLKLDNIKIKAPELEMIENKVSNSVFNRLPAINIQYYTEFYLFLCASFFYALSFLFAFLFVISLTYKKQSIHLPLFIKLFLVLVIVYGLILFFDWSNRTIENIDFLSPELAAYSESFPSFAHGFLASIILFCLVLLTFLMFKNANLNNRFLNIVLRLLTWVFMAVFILYFIPEFINDSVINYDFKEPAILNVYSLLGVLNVFVIGLSWILWSRFAQGFNSANETPKQFLLIDLLLGFLVLVFFYMIRNENFFLLISVLFISTLVQYILRISNKLNFNVLILIGVLLSMILSIQFEQINSSKEKEFRKVFAADIISRKDFDNEVLLKNIESELIATNKIDNFFYVNDSVIKEVALNFKYTFFNDLLKDYDVDIVRFNIEGLGSNDNKYSFTDLNELFNNADHNSYSSYFSNIKDFHFIGGYVAKYEICPADSTLGYVFILIKPKIKSDAYNFENFFSTSNKNHFKNNTYSYAIYQNRQLIKGAGDFTYKLVEDFDFAIKGDESFIDHKKYSHFYKQITNDTYILVSKKSYSRDRITTVFTFIALLFSLLFITLFGFVYIVVFLLSLFNANLFCHKLYLSLTHYFHLINVRKLYLGTKIKIIFMLVAVVICSVVIIFVVKNVSDNFKKRQNEILEKKVTQIHNELELVFQSDERSNLRNLINDLANRFEVDINLYNIDGTLFQSANNRMFFEGWFSSYMNHKAYHQLTIDNQYQFKHSESIGKLKYMSSYISIFDKDYKIVSYLNVPYFAKEIDLQNQFANFLSDLINVLTLILVVFLLIANVIGTSLVKPLKLITESLAKIKLGAENKYIILERNDELGQLVEEYNKMIDELDVSSQKLALSEREGAWKDMAKQVAHEIKNPLTPMRLHLQHLQMAIQRNDDNINSKVAAISQMLIEQIDQLSKMAEEFSSFASMPLAVKEKLDVQDLINNTIRLFRAHSDFSVDFKSQDSDLFVFADALQLQRVFTNIIKNAYQAKRENLPCELIILISKEDDAILIQFKDNGVGISDDFKSKVFAPNFSTKNSGMGLGLSISKKIIEGFDGAIWFESENLNGTTFFVKLPIV